MGLDKATTIAEPPELHKYLDPAKCDLKIKNLFIETDILRISSAAFRRALNIVSGGRVDFDGNGGISFDAKEAAHINISGDDGEYIYFRSGYLSCSPKNNIIKYGFSTAADLSENIRNAVEDALDRAIDYCCEQDDPGEPPRNPDSLPDCSPAAITMPVRLTFFKEVIEQVSGGKITIDADGGVHYGGRRIMRLIILKSKEGDGSLMITIQQHPISYSVIPESDIEDISRHKFGLSDAEFEFLVEKIYEACRSIAASLSPHMSVESK